MPPYKKRGRRGGDVVMRPAEAFARACAMAAARDADPDARRDGVFRAVEGPLAASGPETAPMVARAPEAATGRISAGGA